MASQPTSHRRGAFLDASSVKEIGSGHTGNSAGDYTGHKSVSAPSRVHDITHLDGAVDYIDREAIVGHKAKLPPGYFRSKQFLGVVAVSWWQEPCSRASADAPAPRLNVSPTPAPT